MDNYKKIMCVKGLIMSLDEQLYQLKQKELTEHKFDIIVNNYYKAIKDFLNGKNFTDSERTS